MKKLGKALGAIAIAGAVAAGGSAFTASNTQPASTVAGYGTTSVTGVTVTSVAYTYNAGRDTITAVTLVVDTDTTGDTIGLAWGAGAAATCSDPGTYDGVGDETTYVCTAAQSVATASAWHIIAS